MDEGKNRLKGGKKEGRWEGDFGENERNWKHAKLEEEDAKEVKRKTKRGKDGLKGGEVRMDAQDGTQVWKKEVVELKRWLTFEGEEVDFGDIMIWKEDAKGEKRTEEHSAMDEERMLRRECWMYGMKETE